MESFDIRFLENEGHTAPARTAYGEIRIGSFRERFQSDLSFWNRADYERQWRNASSRIQHAERAAMITSMGDPSTANFIRWWVMYREDEKIFLQEQTLFLEELSAPFDPEAAEHFVRPRQTVSEDG